MAFPIGCNVTEFAQVGVIVHRTYRSFKKAPLEYDEFVREINSLRDVLEILAQDDESRDSLLAKGDDRSRRRLSKILEGCTRVLDEANDMLVKYKALRPNDATSTTAKA
jgi:hypothetical protein